MKKYFCLLFFSINSFANSSNLLSSSDQNGNFKSTYSCKVEGRLELAVNCAIGASVRDSYSDCKNFPCESCIIKSIETTNQAESENFAIAYVTVNIQGLNCK